jgi:hypothetical protein
LATDSIALQQASAPPSRSTVAGTVHTIVLLAVICGGAAWGYFGVGRMRASANPHRPTMYVFTVLWEWLLVVYIAWGARRGVSLRELIGGKWQGAKDVFKDIAIAAGFWIIALVVLVSTSLALHASRTGQSIRVLLPQTHLEIYLWILTSLTAGICEEIIFRGYFQKQFIAWTGSIPTGLLLSAAVFGAGHIYQGVKSSIIIMVYGVLFGILAERRKSLRPGMITHAWHDAITGLVVRLVRA